MNDNFSSSSDIHENTASNLAGVATADSSAENSADQNVFDLPIIPDYEDVSLLGCGVSGFVVKAKSLRFGRDAAVKLMAPNLANHPDAAERFFNEIRQTARLRHEHIARGIDCGRAGKYFYFAMEFVRGESAAAKIRRLQAGKLKEIETLKLVQQAASALHFAYQQGLLIYDLKPQNWRISEDGNLKITDFGVAKDLAFPSAEQFYLANAAYCAPEVAQGENPDIRSALYGLGCAWYEILLGTPPFVSDSPSAILVAQINEAPRAANEIDPKISPATGQLLEWLLRKDRAKRPRVAQQLLATMATHPLLKISDPVAKNSDELQITNDE